MSEHWQGTYLDGRSAARHPAVVSILARGLRLQLEDGRTLFWEYEAVRQVSGGHAGEQARFEKGGELPEILAIATPGFLSALAAQAPEARFHQPRSGGFKLSTGLAAVGALVGGAALIYLWGLPTLAEVAARSVPIAWEEKLGEAVAHKMVDDQAAKVSPETVAAVERIVKTLVPPGSSRYTYRVRVVKNDDVNAFAAPGGYIVVYTGLLEKTRTPEELAGVLAHEIQHVEKRHTTRGLLRQVSFQLLISALTGDTGQLGQVLGAAGTLGTLGYQRGDEAEADREGMALMQRAKLDPSGMVGVFEILAREGGDMPRGFEYLSSHPATEGRLAEMKKLAAKATYEPVPLLGDVDWRSVRRAGK